MFNIREEGDSVGKLGASDERDTMKVFLKLKLRSRQCHFSNVALQLTAHNSFVAFNKEPNTAGALHRTNHLAFHGFEGQKVHLFQRTEPHWPHQLRELRVLNSSQLGASHTFCLDDCTTDEITAFVVNRRTNEPIDLRNNT
mmetsp:Transcript_50065/g.154693  ORF Transcript_50065/g.154693 Transcript_50065/m.154693 type:complete len:141 (+) Transcript_50065:1697-2119(+)